MTTKPDRQPRLKPTRSKGPPATAVDCPGLRTAFEQTGISVVDAAGRARLGRTQVQNWIREGRAPKVGLGRLVKALGVTLEQVAQAPTPLAAARARVAAAQRRARETAAAHEAAKAELRAADDLLKTLLDGI